MSVEMTVALEMNAEGSQQPPEESPTQENSQKAAKKTWTCSQCGEVIPYLPPKVRHLHSSKIRCLKCLKDNKVAEAPADAPAPAPVHEAPRAAPKQRHAGGPHRAQAPRGLTLEVVELCAFRSGIAPPQVETLLAAIRGVIAPSSNK